MSNIYVLKSIIGILLVTWLVYKYGTGIINNTKDTSNKNKFLIANNNHVFKIRNVIYSYVVKVQHINILSFLTVKILIFCSISLFIVSFLISDIVFNSLITSFLLAAPTIFLPYITINMIDEKETSDVDKNVINMLIQLKTHIKISNNIIDAFKRVKTIKYMQIHIEKFNESINRGMSIYKAFEIMKNSFKIKRLKHLINLIKYCMLSGGNLLNLIGKYEKLIIEVQTEKQKRAQDTFYARVVLIILILVNILMVCLYVFANPDYKKVVMGTKMGRVIININIISTYLLVYLIVKIKKLDY